MLVIDFILSTIGLYKVVKCAKKDEEINKLLWFLFAY